ncbi:MAG: FhaA domain-containing protein [Tractidigestivibacter sp.]|jgi:hypothetical protein|uniref:FhaA domain-containing protein n=1 Tax=Tractidigestivibacter sp. TaxID=2847320 RepID=UPI003D8A8D1F
MSFLSDFEDRISSVFDSAPQGYTAPFSFKKLAKRAAREMENETYEIDGVDTAPALYTVLVSSEDDALMRPLYEQITYETSEFVTASANKKGYAFVGKPLVRFMVDQTLKPGKFEVFAENVDSRTLERLRREERAFMGGNSLVGGAASSGSSAKHSPAPAVSTPIPTRQPAAPAASPSATGGTDAGLDVMPAEYMDAVPAVIPAVSSPSSSTPMPVPYIDDIRTQDAQSPSPIRTSTPNASPAPRAAVNQPMQEVQPQQPLQQAQPQPQQQVQPQEVPATLRRATPQDGAHAAMAQAPQATCMLIDRQNGRTYTAKAPSSVIGRERSQCNIILRDPNVSRRHAELTYDGRDWHILDLNSTNGTLVNDIDVDECILRDGDLITVGLVNLEFREN